MKEVIEIKDSDLKILLQRPTVNPYRQAAYQVWQRLKWDLTPEAWRSRHHLQAIRDHYRSQKAVIICNGPSLLKTNLDLLQNTYTFGLNKINLIFDKSNFRPSCIVAMNELVIEQNTDFYNQTRIPLFLNSKSIHLVKKSANTIFLHSSSQKKFARDCSMSVSEGGTVTFIAMQLAFHMGFQEIALVGCDHSFSVTGFSGLVVESEEKDDSHFDPNYFAGGAKWMLPDLRFSEMSYELAKRVFIASGRRIVNATEGGQLEIFERVSLSDFLK